MSATVLPQPGVMQEWHDLLAVILTCKGNEARLQKLLKECERVGISSVNVWYNDDANKSVKKTDTVFAGHYDIIAGAHATSDKDVFVMEDDCQFLFDNAGQRILDAHATAVQSKEWTVLFVGHVPMGPMWRRMDGLYTTTNPYAAHSYILNRKRLGELLNTTPKHTWKRPWMVEGYLRVPIKEKLAVHPALTTQNVLPSEMVTMLHVHRIKDTSLDVWQATMHDAWLRIIPMCMLLGSVIYMSSCARSS
jgi:hypothetical protein